MSLPFKLNPGVTIFGGNTQPQLEGFTPGVGVIAVLGSLSVMLDFSFEQVHAEDMPMMADSTNAQNVRSNESLHSHDLTHATLGVGYEVGPS